MSAAIPHRDAQRSRSEAYRALALPEAAKAVPRELATEWGQRQVRANAVVDGRLWASLGKKRDVRRAGVPAWACAAWLAGYDAEATGDNGAALSPFDDTPQAHPGPET